MDVTRALYVAQEKAQASRVKDYGLVPRGNPDNIEEINKNGKFTDLGDVEWKLPVPPKGASASTAAAAAAAPAKKDDKKKEEKKDDKKKEKPAAAAASDDAVPPPPAKKQKVEAAPAPAPAQAPAAAAATRATMNGGSSSSSMVTQLTEERIRAIVREEYLLLRQEELQRTYQIALAGLPPQKQ
jgi:hypothetical protein